MAMGNASIALVGFVTFLCVGVLMAIVKMTLSLGRLKDNSSQVRIDNSASDCESIQAAPLTASGNRLHSLSSSLNIPSLSLYFSRYPSLPPAKNTANVSDSGILSPSLVPVNPSFESHSDNSNAATDSPLFKTANPVMRHLKVIIPPSPLRAPPLSPSDSCTLLLPSGTTENPAKPSLCDVSLTRPALALVNMNAFVQDCQRFPGYPLTRQSRQHRKANTTAIHISKSRTSKKNSITLQEKHAREFAMKETLGYNGGYKNGVQMTAYLRTCLSKSKKRHSRASSKGNKENIAVL